MVQQATLSIQFMFIPRAGSSWVISIWKKLGCDCVIREYCDAYARRLKAHPFYE